MREEEVKRKNDSNKGGKMRGADVPARGSVKGNGLEGREERKVTRSKRGRKGRERDQYHVEEGWGKERKAEETSAMSQAAGDRKEGKDGGNGGKEKRKVIKEVKMGGRMCADDIMEGGKALTTVNYEIIPKYLGRIFQCYEEKSRCPQP